MEIILLTQQINCVRFMCLTRVRACARGVCRDAPARQNWTGISLIRSLNADSAVLQIIMAKDDCKEFILEDGVRVRLQNYHNYNNNIILNLNVESQ